MWSALCCVESLPQGNTVGSGGSTLESSPRGSTVGPGGCTLESSPRGNTVGPGGCTFEELHELSYFVSCPSPQSSQRPALLCFQHLQVYLLDLGLKVCKV